MPGELQYINLTDFTGGLQLYRNEFQLEMNESPDMLNVTLDRRAGFYVRPGMLRVNGADIADPLTWDPRSARTIILQAGATASYITSQGVIYTSDTGATWVPLQIGGVNVSCSAAPHLADFVSWGDKTYIAAGPDDASHRQTGNFVATTNEPVALLNAETATFDDDYTIPSSGVMPRCEVAEAHAGYLFCANTFESGAYHQNRLRWSHPLNPEAYATNDYIDIETGGGEITALLSYQDHLLIFKTDSMWALYGYETDSFQLIKVSRDIGVVSPGAVTRSETSVFLYSASDRGDIYVYDGGVPSPISEALRPVMDAITAPNDVWITWSGRRLAVSLPWNEDPQDSSDRSVFFWDPSVGRGAWTRYGPATDEVRCLLDRGDNIVDGDVVFVMAGGTAGICKTGGVDSQGLDFIRFGAPGEAFSVRYRTGWIDAGYPERPESWRRPRFIMTTPTLTTEINVNTYHNYDKGSPRRSHTMTISNTGAVVWRLTGSAEEGGFDWGDGTLWSEGSEVGGQIRRAQPIAAGRSGLGIAAAVQLEVTTDSSTSVGARWGINAIILKHRSRRGTT